MRIRLKPIEEQVVVLMGASSGIGLEAARRFADRGARVVISARGEEALAELTREFRAAGHDLMTLPADVTDFEQVRNVADRTVERYGRLDTWVHLAGIGLWATLEETRPEEWRRVIDVNLNGQAYGAKAALPYLKQDGGALIHVSSVEARFALPYQTAYSASKHAVHALVKALRLELEHERAAVSVTEIMPAGTNTRIFDAARTRIGVKPMPIPPIYEPSVVAEAILFAAEHPVRELVTGGVSAAGMLLQRVSPRLMDRFLLWQGFRSQQTDERKSEAAPANLWEPQDRPTQSEGELVPARRTSFYTWMETHPTAKRAAVLGMIGAAAYAGFRKLRRPG